MVLSPYQKRFSQNHRIAQTSLSPSNLWNEIALRCSFLHSFSFCSNAFKYLESVGAAASTELAFHSRSALIFSSLASFISCPLNQISTASRFKGSKRTSTLRPTRSGPTSKLRPFSLMQPPYQPYVSPPIGRRP
jgi:hypothetical protein